MPQRLDGLPLLGSAVQGEFESILGVYGLEAEPARRRLAGALALIEKIKQLAISDVLTGHTSPY